MRKLQNSIIIVLIINLILVFTYFVLPTYAEAAPVTNEGYYSKLVVVTKSIQTKTSIWIVNCRDKNGNIWQFRNRTGDLQRGDILTLLMLRVNENELDDECRDYTWEGYTDDLNLFLKIMGWR